MGKALTVSTLLAAIAVILVASRRGETAKDGLETTTYYHDGVFQGTLLLSFYDSTPHTTQPHRHRFTFVNGPAYQGMEDNDLRGFLDGSFKYAWNQPGQVHVRVGRRGESPRYGEYELFRVLQRWSDIELPPLAKVVSARLVLSVEEPEDGVRQILLYEVKKDWVPGNGGIDNDNVSPPKSGEVWWNEAQHGAVSWGLPGVGFSSSVDSDADTDRQPLAWTEYRAGDSTVTFTSSRLAEYITRRVAERQPLLFLLKLSDYQEDIPGARIMFYSGNHGDSRNVSRRPRLTIEWESPTELRSVVEDIALEYGRTISLPIATAEGAQYAAVSFDAASLEDSPTIRVTGGRDSLSERVITGVGTTHVLRPWSRSELTVHAAHDPIVLGDTFTAELKDTWVRSGPPEKQVVPWVFISPSKARTEVTARYLGENRWAVEFLPDELGAWEYYWTQNFTDTPYRSADGHFDVVAGDLVNVSKQLAILAAQIEAQGVIPREERDRWIIQLVQLERSALLLQTPESYRSPRGIHLRELIERVRRALGEPVPESNTFSGSI